MRQRQRELSGAGRGIGSEREAGAADTKDVYIPPPRDGAIYHLYCSRFNPTVFQLRDELNAWYLEFVDGAPKWFLWESRATVLEAAEGDGYSLTPKVPTWRHHCLAHVLSTANFGSASGATQREGICTKCTGPTGKWPSVRPLLLRSRSLFAAYMPCLLA